MTAADLSLPKRFYNEVSVHRRDDAWAVQIDGRQLRTPGKRPFVISNKSLAEASAAEWRAQTTHIRPETMPVTRLINVALDHIARTRGRVVESIAGYAATDLVCHRADGPASLVARQAKLWDPLLAWARSDLRAPLEVVTGVIAAEQPYAAGEAFARAANAMDDFRLTALAHTVGISGSGVIGFAMAYERLGWEDAFEAACVDDLWQLETWGEDMAARERLNAIRGEFQTAGLFFAALA